VLLAEGDPVAALLHFGAPRWALPAARLACQALLSQPDTADTPISRRLARVQAAFDGIGSAGHGSRWSDVPMEALLTLGDPGPVLVDAWREIRDGDGAGLARLLRLVDQRHREGGAFVDPVVAEPIVALLLDEEAPRREEDRPWRSDNAVAALLRDWLLILAVRRTPAGYLLRTRLRDRLVAACERAHSELVARQAADSAVRVAPTAEEIEAERARLERQQPMRSVLGLGRPARRRRPELPRELTDETVVELLALLGPDMGDAGEHLLRRVATDAPWELAPALEELGTGLAVSQYGRGLLADLVEAYYIDDREDRSGFHEDGVRDHHSRGFFGPLSGATKGPFIFLFQTDLRRGVAALNRLLNHAARERVRTLLSLGNPWGRHVIDAELEPLAATLSLTGTPLAYHGDTHVWRWYRGTGVGPYPCMSALQALEQICDQFLSSGVAVDRLIALLMDGCENLAMPGFVLGLLVRHIETAGRSLDSFLEEPLVWHLEFNRLVHESSGLAASSEGLVAPERRTWSCREAASWLTVNADAERVTNLKAVGARLVERAEALEAASESEQPDEEANDAAEAGPPISTLAKAWASALDRDLYQAHIEGDTIYVQTRAPEEIEAALQPGNDDLQRGQEAVRIQWRYFAGGVAGRQKTPPPVAEELASDLATAEALFDDPPTMSAVPIWDMAAAIAAHTVETIVLAGETVSAEGVAFALRALFAVANGEQADPNEFEGSLYEQGADRAAARALPLLLLDEAQTLRALIDPDEASVETRIVEACRRLAHIPSYEVRLHLARALDAIWKTPCCATGRCRHSIAVELAIETMRECVLGDWDMAGQQRLVEALRDPIGPALDRVEDDRVYFSRLDAAIRALANAASHPSCVQSQARELLDHVFSAHRRGLLAQDKHFDDRGTHALVAARAVLDLAQISDLGLLHECLDAYADNSALLSRFLRALGAAAEETAERAEVARRIWPDVITRVLELHAAGHETFTGRHYGSRALAELMPTPTHEIEYFYWELGEAPVRWVDPLSWEEAVDAWIPVAAGDPEAVDSLIGLVRALPEIDQARFGLPRVATLVGANVEVVAKGSARLPQWLTDIRAGTLQAGNQSTWQNLVDALVVAGNRTLAPYSE
jgi:hypothetical protein